MLSDECAIDFAHPPSCAHQDTVETALLALHDAIRAGDIKIDTAPTSDRKQRKTTPFTSVFPPDALKLFIDHGVAQPHEPDASAPPTHSQVRLSTARVGPLTGWLAGWLAG